MLARPMRHRVGTNDGRVRGNARPLAWSPEEDLLVLRMREAGQSFLAIGAAVRRSNSAARERFLALMEARNQQMPGEGPGAKTRLCLCGCGTTFRSMHAGERIRPEHRDQWSKRV